MLDDSRLRTIGGRRPTGTAMSPGRRAGLGGTCAPPHAARVQSVLPVHGQRDGGRRPEPGGFPAYLSHTFELPTGIWSVSDVADERDAQFAGRSLPADSTRSANGFNRRRNAAVGRKTFFGAGAGQTGRGGGVKHPTAARLGTPFTRTEGVGNFARFAGPGIQRDSDCVAGAR